MPDPTHPLFPTHGYEVQPKPENLYLGGEPQPGQRIPNKGIFYVSMEAQDNDNPALSYTVTNPGGNVVTNTITLAQIRDKLNDQDFVWPELWSLDALQPYLSAIWEITAERRDTLPNPRYIADRKADFPSDHLPITGNVGNIQLVSWNTMGKGATNFSAFRYDEFAKQFDGNGYPVNLNEDYADARYARIVTALQAISADKNLIHLQETNIDATALQSALGERWTVIDSVEQSNRDERQKQRAALNRVVTCFRNDVFTLESIVDNTGAANGDRYLEVALRHQQSEAVTHCYNVWTAYNAFPEVHETYYRAKIDAARNAGHHVVIAGDTNTRMLPVRQYTYNITTGLIPPTFLRENAAYQADNTLMIPDFPDGILYFDPQNNTVAQVEFAVVDLQGQPVAAPAPELDQLTDAERLMYTEYRATLSLAELSDLEDNLKTLQQEVRDVMHDPAIAIRDAVNPINQRGIALMFSSADSVAYQAVQQKIQAQQLAVSTSNYDNALSDRPEATRPIIIAGHDQKDQLVFIIHEVIADAQQRKQTIATQIQTLFQPQIMTLVAAAAAQSDQLAAAKAATLTELQTTLEDETTGGTIEEYRQKLQEWKDKQITRIERPRLFGAEKREQVTYAACIAEHRSTFFGFGTAASASLVDELDNIIERAFR